KTDCGSTHRDLYRDKDMDSAAVDSGGEGPPQQKRFSKLSEYSPLSDDCVSEVEGDYLDPNFASIANTPMPKLKFQSPADHDLHNGNGNSQPHIKNAPKNPFSAPKELLPLRAVPEDNISMLSQEDDVCSSHSQQLKKNQKRVSKCPKASTILVILLLIFVSISLGLIILSVNYDMNLKAAQSELVAAQLIQKPLREERQDVQIDFEDYELKNQIWQEEVDQLKAEVTLLKASEVDLKKKMNNSLQKQEDIFQQLQTSEEDLKKKLNNSLQKQEDISQQLKISEDDAKKQLNEATHKYEELIKTLKSSEQKLSVESDHKLQLLKDKTRRAMVIASKLLINSSRSDSEAWTNILEVVKEELESQIVENSSQENKNIGFYHYENADDVLAFYSSESISQNSSSKNRYARLTFQNGKLHQHVLQELTPPPHAIILPHEQIKNAVSSGSVTTFIDLAWPGHSPSRVYIKLYGSTDRAQQFLWLCTGELGPSYVNSKFDAVLNKGSPGEYIVGGNYEGMSSPSLIQNLTEGGVYLKPSNEGLVTGVVMDDSTNNAKFGIYVEEESTSKNAVGFGQVVGEKSMATIKLAAKYDNITEIVVTDCGIVLNL
ncbi:unnamed protein product, partial [Meganyctiphanes norvegica]